MSESEFTFQDEIYMAAVAAGCDPEWQEGQFHAAWHCGCPDNRHGINRNSTYLTRMSLQRAPEAEQ